MRDKIISKAAIGVCGALGALADMKVPGFVLKPAIRAYSLGFQVNQNEASIPAEGFSCFGDFFARSLRDGARSICDERNAFVSPCDGKIVAVQSIDSKSADVFTVKGFNYSITQLLGPAPMGASYEERFGGGQGMVIYLHPRDYHRVHVPATVQLLEVRHIAGARFPVAPWSEERVSGIFQRNERMVFHLKLGSGYLTMVMVAAFGVGHIATPYAPPKGDHRTAVRVFDGSNSLHIGDEIGAFRLGSTVVMLWSKELLHLSPATGLGKILLGEKLGTLAHGNASAESLE
ncbi:MAG: phosphatidylserine decarboxylase [Deltaproteobacteria bacterium]|nr:phosphatidylserine decarboxylase [Deltaproteobacteria bacterium]MBN2671524.1 phosphatidylserine decarboxylase [Deltaproteobacteria bacterium]